MGAIKQDSQNRLMSPMPEGGEHAFPKDRPFNLRRGEMVYVFPSNTISLEMSPIFLV